MIQDKIHQIFVENGYTWTIDGETRTPTPDEIRRNIDRMKDNIDDGEQITLGRIVVMRTNDIYDIFVMIAEERETL